ncbi:MAG TPA: MotA/TolQ/ExbB proton channel family protein [bacterium]|nr:MotA/TolQ/ExbB proton channel family protein [bacterium]HOL47579.1 MotA/TolQ/ExbB proton channel family protein [bacterium]HPQ18841.1 MotA/TolQ/ExbB proton channel family protein [bacterium]
MIYLLKTFYNFLAKGGPVMIPIILCSIIGLAIIIERIKLFRKFNYNVDEILENLKTYITMNKFNEAINYCHTIKSPIAKIASKIIISYLEKEKDLEKVVEEELSEEMPILERHLGILGIIANISPLLGLLGTVTGIIKSFTVISQQSLGDPSKLAAGIAEALITTAAGLIVAIPALAMYNYFLTKIDSLSWGIEKVSNKLIKLLMNKEEINEN